MVDDVIDRVFERKVKKKSSLFTASFNVSYTDELKNDGNVELKYSPSSLSELQSDSDIVYRVK